MVSTVTTTTVTTITTIAALGFTATVSIAAAATLIAFLGTRELAGASTKGSLRIMSRFLSVGIVPLIMTFAVIVAAKIAEVMS